MQWQKPNGIAMAQQSYGEQELTYLAEGFRRYQREHGKPDFSCKTIIYALPGRGLRVMSKYAFSANRYGLPRG